MIANSSPQLAWLAPNSPDEPAAPNVVMATAPSPELQQLALDLAAVRQSVDRLTGQITAGQQQMGSDIAKLQAGGQEILHKLAAASPRPAPAPAHKPPQATPTPLPSPQARN
jgi:hypothetical protein